MPFSPATPDDQPYRFTPVPRRSDRADGWSSDRQHAFVWALARLPSVTAAARSVGMSARSAYRLRAAPGAEGFAKAWDEAWQMGLDVSIDTAFDRAVNGQEYPIVYRGRVVGKVHRYDNSLLMRTLAHQDRAFERNNVSRARNLRGVVAKTIETFAGADPRDVESLGRAP